MRIGEACKIEVNSPYVGIRPVLVIPKNSPIPSNGDGICKLPNGIIKVKYGYFPQTINSNNLKLRTQSQRKLMTKRYAYTQYIGEIYGLWVKCSANRYCKFDDKAHLIEYERYPEFIYPEEKGSYIKRHEGLDVEVVPIEWLVDEKEYIMVSTRVLMEGIPLNRAEYYLNEIFLKEITQAIEEKKVNYDDKKEKIDFMEKKEEAQRITRQLLIQMKNREEDRRK